MDILPLIIGLVIGIIIAYVIFYLFNKTKSVAKIDFDNLTNKHNEVSTTLKITEDKLQTYQAQSQNLTEKLNSKESEVSQLQTKATALETNLKHNENKIFELTQTSIKETEININQQDEINKHKQTIAELSANHKGVTENLNTHKETNEKQTNQINELNLKLTEFTSNISKLNANNSSLTEKLETQKTEIIDIQKTAHLQFEKIANQIFEEKSTKFTETNKTNIETLLNPLKEDLGKFKTKIEETHTEDTKQRTSLEERIKGLIDQTNKVSTEANNLATALKGKPQKRGNWGEMILERILETSGLTKDREYFVQSSIKDEEGNNLRPDVRINLPDQRVIMVDSKVSLIAYDKFSATEDVEEQRIYLAEHLKATYSHIDQLSDKKYDNIESSLDFTMMFVPIEPAYMITIQADQEMWTYAYSKRILLVSPTNLIACLKMFSDLWKRDSQSKNAMEIVKRGELLYEKFVTFVSTLEDVGKHINKTQQTYSAAIGQLNSGSGHLVGQALKLKNLGLKSDKQIPISMQTFEIENESESEKEENLLPEKTTNS
jgi:DNA recombination protein RmuC